MTRIANTEQVLLLLRAHLERTARQGRKNTKKVSSRDSVRATPLKRLREISDKEELPQEAFKRAIVQGLLAEELGEEVLNDPLFQKLVDEVHDRIKRDEDSNTLLDLATRQLAGSDP